MSEQSSSQQPIKLQGLEEVQSRLHAHPGYVEYLRIEAFGLSLNAVFRSNLILLLGMLRGAATDTDLQTQLIQNVARPDVRNAFNAATINSLHNYVAGTMTLVDHSRRLMAGRTGEIELEYGSQKTELLKHPEVRFIQELRNFMLHRSLPFLGHTYSFTKLNTPEAQFDLHIELSVNELLQWNGWTSSSRAYLATFEEGKLQLLPLIEAHGDLIFRFNAWIMNAVSEANRADLSEANELVVERNAILGGVDMDTARKLTDEFTRRRTTTPWPPQADGPEFEPNLSNKFDEDSPIDIQEAPAED